MIEWTITNIYLFAALLSSLLLILVYFFFIRHAK